LNISTYFLFIFELLYDTESKLKMFFKKIPLFILFFAISCSDAEIVLEDDVLLKKIEIPLGFPEISFPTDNAFTPERWALGKKLFYDKRLSRNSSLNCASCHKQSDGFADHFQFSDGIENRPGTRNAPSLANVAYHPYFTREGGVPTLEMQILIPIQEHNEFDFSLVLLQERLKDDNDYQEMSMKAYGRPLDAFTITRSISTFERSILSGNSRYDKYLTGSQLTSSEIKGKDLFFSKRTNCSTCHSGFNFTNYNFENNGLYTTYPDVGRYRLTNKEEDLAMFKTQSLRNIGFTAPYMHDGSLATLDEVIDHYNSGGKQHQNKSPLIKPLGLSENEKNDLKVFLLTLDDYKFRSNKLLAE
jgi:cytochrome c peroxidase